jgi:hypothetical protein
MSSSVVSVPVLSKQQMSTLPANGMRNGSVQKMAAARSAAAGAERRGALTQLRQGSMGSSGGMTEVMISTQSSTTFQRVRPDSMPAAARPGER